MRRSSSTSGSDRRARRTLLLFFGTVFCVVLGSNLLLLDAYRRHRYASPSGEYAQKLASARAAFASGRPITTLFAGDSTVSVGIMPRVLGPDAINIAWSGFEPSELGILETRIAELPATVRRLYIGLNPTFLSQNEWRNTLNVPFPIVAKEALQSFYSDTNSFKPLVVMGGLAALSERFLSAPFGGGAQVMEDAATRTVVEDDGLLVVQPERKSLAAPRVDIKLPFRESNFRMLEDFRRRLAGRGIRVVWLFMPYSTGLEHALREGHDGSRFFARYRAEIHRIFGADSVDLSGSVPDDLFRDEVHLSRAGAERVTYLLRQIVAGGGTSPATPVPAAHTTAVQEPGAPGAF